MEAGSGVSGSPELTVVLSTLGNYQGLQRVLDGYSTQTAPPASFEVVVVVDAAEKDRGAVDAAIGNRPFKLRVLNGTAPGLSANRNTGWRAAEANVVLFTDNDTIPVPRLVAEHRDWHRVYPDEATGVLGHVRWAPELHISTFMRWLDTGFQFDFDKIQGIEAGWGRMAGANVSLKRSFIERVGDFDQEHLPYLYEDTEWAYRASKAGFRLVYNARAVVDHLNLMTLEYWQQRSRRVASEEYKFWRLHPELEPWFHRIFSAAAAAPKARGRGVRLAPYVPKELPWLGPRVWASVDMYYKQAIAPYFLDAWEEAERTGQSSSTERDLSEYAAEHLLEPSRVHSR